MTGGTGGRTPATARPVGRPRDGRLVVQAPAKLNLHLEVLGRRDDGYHELVTVLQTLDLCDTLELSVRARRDEAVPGEPDVRLTAAAEGGLPRLSVPAGADNLAVAAACALLREAGAAGEVGVDLALTKRIPAGGGLGGGSSDAAAALAGLNALLGSPCDEARLARLAAGLGSDVPFFLVGGTALCTGRGEHVLPIAPPAPFAVVLALPDFGLPTPAVYRALSAPALAGRPPHARAHDALPAAHRNLVAALAGARPERLRTLLRNDLQPAALAVEPRLLPLLAVPGSLLCGSGSSVFVLGADDPWVHVGQQDRSLCFVTARSKNR